jgi:hypothetical protein
MSHSVATSPPSSAVSDAGLETVDQPIQPSTTPPTRGSLPHFTSTPAKFRGKAIGLNTLGRREGVRHPKHKGPLGIEEVDLPDDWCEVLGTIKEEIRSSRLREGLGIYDPLCELLNRISIEVSRRRETLSVVTYASHPNKPPKDDFLEYNTKPDIIGYITTAEDALSRLNLRQQKGAPTKGKTFLMLNKRYSTE